MSFKFLGNRLSRERDGAESAQSIIVSLTRSLSVNFKDLAQNNKMKKQAFMACMRRRPSRLSVVRCICSLVVLAFY